MYQRILLLNRLRIGDCIFTTPAIRALRHAYPRARIVVVVPAANADLFRHSPHVDAVLARPVRSWREKTRFVRALRAERFDLTISFQEKSIFYALAARFGGAGHSLSLEHWRTRRFYRETVPWPGETVHRVERYLTLVEAAGAPARDRGFAELFLTPRHRERAESLLTTSGLRADDLLVAINPGSTERSRRWEPARFAAVADRLAREAGTRILLLGSAGDAEMAREIAAWMRAPAVDLCGRTGLLETAAVLERCALQISGDTGPLHVGAAMGTPVVALFGPSDPVRAAPRPGPAPGAVRLLRSAGACPRCTAPCLHTISAEVCAEAAFELLQAGSRARRPEPVVAGSRSG